MWEVCLLWVRWCALGTAKTVARVPWINLGNRDRLDGSYVCPNHKEEYLQFTSLLMYCTICRMLSSDV